MKKYIEISEEVLARLVEGKVVEGRLIRNEWTGRVEFKPYNRKPRDRKERTVVELEHGWLKESPKRYKFYNSVKKPLGRRLVDVVMHRELKQAMQVLEIEEIIDNV